MAEEPDHTTPPACDPAQSIQRSKAARNYSLLKPTVPTKLNLQRCPLHRRPAPAIGGGFEAGPGHPVSSPKETNLSRRPKPTKVSNDFKYFGLTTGL